METGRVEIEKNTQIEKAIEINIQGDRQRELVEGEIGTKILKVGQRKKYGERERGK